MISELVRSATILADVQATTKDAAIKELVQAAQAAGIVPKKKVAALGKKVLDRESLGSTGIGNGVAVPHVKSEDVQNAHLVFGRVRGGLEWHAIDGRPVHILFFLVSPAEAAEAHLRCLRWISMLARNGDFRRFCLDAADDKGLRDLLGEMVPKE